jgi:hypothetical protein
MPSAFDFLAKLLASSGRGQSASILRGAAQIIKGLRDISKSLGPSKSKRAIEDALREQSFAQLLGALGNQSVTTPQGTFRVKSSPASGSKIVLPNGQVIRVPGTKTGKIPELVPEPEAVPSIPEPEAPGAALGEARQAGIKGAIKLQRVASSNVYAIGYDPETGTLRVQYLAGGQGLKSKEAKTRAKTKAGAMYDYYNVPPRLWASFQAAGSKGRWVWDKLRVRGTIAGHKFDYTLVAGTIVGVGRVYVPRLATVKTRISRTAGVSQTGLYAKRTIIVGGKQVKSQLSVSTFPLGKPKYKYKKLQMYRRGR